MPRFTRDEDALTTSLYATAGSSFVDSGDVAELKRDTVRIVDIAESAADALARAVRHR